jgi:hypothetical protein
MQAKTAFLSCKPFQAQVVSTSSGLLIHTRSLENFLTSIKASAQQSSFTLTGTGR